MVALADLQSYEWELSYRSSSTNSQGKPVDILHDFYLPALQRIKYYDRVAGYFRSSSLAAASQGYTAFLEHGGRMRLIVGADLQLVDVAAILKGNQHKLSDKLLEELAGAENWPEAVRNGVALLSAMVEKGQLEVRVAFRVHGNTGEPMAVDSVADGYVHEKWFVMEDAAGNQILGSGSLNESRTALCINAENIEVACSWEGGRDQKRVERAVADFDALWHNRNPHMRVYRLPEAVKKQLVRLKVFAASQLPTEIDGTSEYADCLLDVSHVAQDVGSEEAEKELSALDILRFAVLHDAPTMPGGIYIGMYSAPVEPWPHQEIVARRLVESFPYSYLLCDEVGLGKTIEAALAIRSLVLSGRAKRVLIVPPAGLARQWHRELAAKALLPFARSSTRAGYKGQSISEWIYPQQHETFGDNLFVCDYNIVSHGLVSRRDRGAQLSKADDFDIVLVDEAHYARRSNPRYHCQAAPKYGRLYETLSKRMEKKSKGLWLATATPMQIDAVEVYDLLRLTGRVGQYRYDASLCMAYFELLSKILQKKELTWQEWSFLGQSFSMVEATDPYLWELLQRTVVNNQNRKVLGKLPIDRPKRADERYLKKPLFAASPLGRVMLRHTRALLEKYREHGELKANLARRSVLPICAIRFTAQEAEFYAALGEYCDELQQQILSHNEQNRQVVSFFLNFLQLRFASSLDAIRCTLARRRSKVEKTLLFGGGSIEDEEDLRAKIAELQEEEDSGYGEDDWDDITLADLLKKRSREDLEWEKDKLAELLDRLECMNDTPSKIKKLLEVIDGRRSGQRVEQMVVFTRFTDTLNSIRSYLYQRAPRLKVGVYAGSFARYADQGRDIETTHDVLKNMFLQEKIDILLCTDAAAEGLNLQTANLLVNFDLGWNPMKIEQRIGRIDRIGQKHKFIEVMNMCYLGSTEEIVYGRLLQRLAEANLIVGMQQVSMLPVTPEEFRQLDSGKLTEKKLEQAAKKHLLEQQQRIRSMELDVNDLYDMYKKIISQNRQMQLPATVDDIWQAFADSVALQARGMQVDGDGKMQLEVAFTKDRGEVDENVHYLTWGEAKVDAILTEGYERSQQCKWLRKISVEQYGIAFCGYLVAGREGCVLITSYGQLAGLEVDADYELTEDDVAGGREQLLNMCREYFVWQKQRQDSLVFNEEWAKYNADLIRYAAVGVLEYFQQQGTEMVVDVVRELENSPQAKYIVHIPPELGRKERFLLFAVQYYAHDAQVMVNGMLIGLVHDFLCRQMTVLKDKKSTISIERLLVNIKSPRFHFV